MINFDFMTANRIIFGPGTSKKIGENVKPFGNKALIISGIPDDHIDLIITKSLQDAGIKYFIRKIGTEPTVGMIEKTIEEFLHYECDFVIGLGGGSAIDTGKAVAILANNPGDPYDYLEVVGKGKRLINKPLPCIAVPTTSGTGSEVTKNAVLTAEEFGVKVSLRNAFMLPVLAIIDPELTLSLPPEITASTGIDALTQLIEPFVSNRSNPITDSLCREGIKRAARSLPIAFQDGQNINARQDMCIASLFGGIALANARLGAVHGFAAPLGGLLKAPHGALCARLLPIVFEINITALLNRSPESEALPRFLEICKLITDHPLATFQNGIDWLLNLTKYVKIPSLAAYELRRDDFRILVENASKSSSMQGNPIQLEEDELFKILERAF